MKAATRAAQPTLKSKLEPIRRDMDEALAEMAKKHGLQSLKAGRCIYDPHFGSFTFRVEGVDNGGKDKNAAEYEMMADTLGLPPLGTVFQRQGQACTIVGMTSGGKVVYERNGKRWLVRIDDVKQALLAARPRALRRAT